jgi:hypothetical protein
MHLHITCRCSTLNKHGGTFPFSSRNAYVVVQTTQKAAIKPSNYSWINRATIAYQNEIEAIHLSVKESWYLENSAQLIWVQNVCKLGLTISNEADFFWRESIEVVKAVQSSEHSKTYHFHYWQRIILNDRALCCTSKWRETPYIRGPSVLHTTSTMWTLKKPWSFRSIYRAPQWWPIDLLA